MKIFLTFFSFLLIFSACEQKNEQKIDESTSINDEKSIENNFGIILHGGAGTI